MRGKSILQPNVTKKTKECYITGYKGLCELHHCYPGPNRKTSDVHGFWCYLTPETHRQVHDNPNEDIDLMLKMACQTLYERKHSREAFIKLIGRSYL